MSWEEIGVRLKQFFTVTLEEHYGVLILQFILFFMLFYAMFKVLKSNRCTKFSAVITFGTIFSGITFALSGFPSELLLVLILMIVLLVFTMFHTEIKRSMLDSGLKKVKHTHVTISGVEEITDEVIRAVQNMSKNDIGALIVLSNENLPEGIVDSGTVVDAKISSQMIEAVFYPKAPLHDGAMIIEGNKIYAAGCFLPLAEHENLPKEMGSRHRAALGVTTVANVTAIVVSEETGVISIMRNGVVKKKYADASDIKNALSDYYWSDLTAEGKI